MTMAKENEWIDLTEAMIFSHTILYQTLELEYWPIWRESLFMLLEAESAARNQRFPLRLNTSEAGYTRLVHISEANCPRLVNTLKARNPKLVQTYEEGYKILVETLEAGYPLLVQPIDASYLLLVQTSEAEYNILIQILKAEYPMLAQTLKTDYPILDHTLETKYANSVAARLTMFECGKVQNFLRSGQTRKVKKKRTKSGYSSFVNVRKDLEEGTFDDIVTARLPLHSFDNYSCKYYESICLDIHSNLNATGVISVPLERSFGSSKKAKVVFMSESDSDQDENEDEDSPGGSGCGEGRLEEAYRDVQSSEATEAFQQVPGFGSPSCCDDRERMGEIPRKMDAVHLPFSRSVSGRGEVAPCILICGEVTAGKSSLINLLLGSVHPFGVCEEDNAFVGRKKGTSRSVQHQTSAAKKVPEYHLKTDNGISVVKGGNNGTSAIGGNENRRTTDETFNRVSIIEKSSEAVETCDIVSHCYPDGNQSWMTKHEAVIVVERSSDNFEGSFEECETGHDLCPCRNMRWTAKSICYNRVREFCGPVLEPTISLLQNAWSFKNSYSMSREVVNEPPRKSNTCQVQFRLSTVLKTLFISSLVVGISEGTITQNQTVTPGDASGWPHTTALALSLSHVVVQESAELEEECDPKRMACQPCFDENTIASTLLAPAFSFLGIRRHLNSVAVSISKCETFEDVTRFLLPKIYAFCKAKQEKIRSQILDWLSGLTFGAARYFGRGTLVEEGSRVFLMWMWPDMPRGSTLLERCNKEMAVYEGIEDAGNIQMQMILRELIVVSVSVFSREDHMQLELLELDDPSVIHWCKKYRTEWGMTDFYKTQAKGKGKGLEDDLQFRYQRNTQVKNGSVYSQEVGQGIWSERNAIAPEDTVPVVVIVCWEALILTFVLFAIYVVSNYNQRENSKACEHLKDGTIVHLVDSNPGKEKTESSYEDSSPGMCREQVSVVTEPTKEDESSGIYAEIIETEKVPKQDGKASSSCEEVPGSDHNENKELDMHTTPCLHLPPYFVLTRGTLRVESPNNEIKQVPLLYAILDVMDHLTVQVSKNQVSRQKMCIDAYRNGSALHVHRKHLQYKHIGVVANAEQGEKKEEFQAVSQSVLRKSEVIRNLVEFSLNIPDVRKCQQSLIKAFCSDRFMRQEVMKCMRMQQEVRNFELLRLLAFNLMAPTLNGVERTLSTSEYERVFSDMLSVMQRRHKEHGLFRKHHYWQSATKGCDDTLTEPTEKLLEKKTPKEDEIVPVESIRKKFFEEFNEIQHDKDIEVILKVLVNSIGKKSCKVDGCMVKDEASPVDLYDQNCFIDEGSVEAVSPFSSFDTETKPIKKMSSDVWIFVPKKCLGDTIEQFGSSKPCGDSLQYLPLHDKERTPELDVKEIKRINLPNESKMTKSDESDEWIFVPKKCLGDTTEQLGSCEPCGDSLQYLPLHDKERTPELDVTEIKRINLPNESKMTKLAYGKADLSNACAANSRDTLSAFPLPAKLKRDDKSDHQTVDETFDTEADVIRDEESLPMPVPLPTAASDEQAGAGPQKPEIPKVKVIQPRQSSNHQKIETLCHLHLNNNPLLKKGLKKREKKDAFTDEELKGIVRDHTWLPLDKLPPARLELTHGIVGNVTYAGLNAIFRQIAVGNTPGPATTMKYELLRLCTLRNYPKDNKPYLIRLAASGFYYAADGDEVVCYCCGVRRNDWVESDVPDEIHKRLSPKCSFFLRNEQVNFPVPRHVEGAVNKFVFLEEFIAPPLDDEGEDVCNDFTGPTRRQLEQRIGQPSEVSSGSRTSSSSLGVNMQNPKHPHYSVKSVRLNSYVGWPESSHQDPAVLAEAGFYFAGIGDCVRCFHCGVGLRHWAAEDNPWIEHARWSQTCAYLRQCKGEEFINLVHMAIQITRDEEPSAPGSQPNEETTKVLMTDAAQSVLEMGYDTRIIRKAIDILLRDNGRTGMTAQRIMEKVLEIEEEENAAETSREMQKLDLNRQDTPTSSTPSDTTPAVCHAQAAGAQGAVAGSGARVGIGAQGGKAAADSQTGGKKSGLQSKEKSSKSAVPGVAGQNPKQIKEENEKLKEQTLCKICMDRTVCIVFLPCGHLVTCAECAPALRKCPICRSLVKGTVKTYMS